MDDRFNEYYETMKTAFGKSLSDEAIREHAKFMADKHLTVKRGENVIHLTYVKELLTIDDIQSFQEELAKHSLELSYYDKSGIITNFFDDFTGTIELVFAAKFTEEVINHVASAYLWNIFKNIGLRIFKKVKDKKVYKQGMNGSTEERDATLFLVIRKDETTTIDFRLTGNFVDEDLASKTLDKALEFVKEHPANIYPKRATLVELNLDHQKLSVIDTDAIIARKVEEQRSKTPKKMKTSSSKKTGNRKKKRRN